MNLLLLPGVNNMPSTFDSMRDHFAGDHMIDSFDCPAKSSVEEVASAILTNAPDKFVGLGHSFGGHVAMAMAAIAPERLAGLIFVNSCDWPDTPELVEMRKDKAQRALDGEYEAFAAAASARAYHPDNAERTDLLEERAKSVKAYGAERFAAHQLALAARPDRREYLKASGLPILVVTADHDVVIPTDMQEEMANQLGADFVKIEQAGHMAPVEQPEQIAGAVTAWLDKLNAN